MYYGTIGPLYDVRDRNLLRYGILFLTMNRKQSCVFPTTARVCFYHLTARRETGDCIFHSMSQKGLLK